MCEIGRKKLRRRSMSTSTVEPGTLSTSFSMKSSLRIQIPSSSGTPGTRKVHGATCISPGKPARNTPQPLSTSRRSEEAASSSSSSSSSPSQLTTKRDRVGASPPPQSRALSSGQWEVSLQPPVELQLLLLVSAACVSSFSFFPPTSSNLSFQRRGWEEAECGGVHLLSQASTGRPRVGRQSPEKCRRLRSLLCGPGSGGGVFCARRPACVTCSSTSPVLAAVFCPRGAPFCCIHLLLEASSATAAHVVAERLQNSGTARKIQP